MTIALAVRGKDCIVMATDSCLTVGEPQCMYLTHVQKTFLLPTPFNIGVSFSGSSNIASNLGIDSFIFKFFDFCLNNTQKLQGLDDIARFLIEQIRLVKNTSGELHALIAGYVSVDGVSLPKVRHLCSASDVDDEFFCGPGINCIGECDVFKRIHTNLTADERIPKYSSLGCFKIPISDYTAEDAMEYCNYVIQATEAEHKNVSGPNHMLLINSTASHWLLPPPIDMGLENVWGDPLGGTLNFEIQ